MGSIKSIGAAELSMEAFIIQNAPQIYLWTFTFEDALYPKVAMKGWGKFTKRIKRRFPTIGGVRVTEWHPGKIRVVINGEEERLSHGVHIHLITNLWLPVAVVRQLANDIFGRINVKFCDDLSEPRKLATYLSKYLKKEMRDRTLLLKGARLWANWGNWEGVKCKDVEYKTAFSSFYKRLKFFYEDGNRYELGMAGDPRFLAFEGFYKAYQTKKSKGALFKVFRTAREFFNSLSREEFEKLDYFFQEETRKFYPARPTAPF